ncbi:glycosyl transferase family 1 [Methylomonas sp. LWB]|uniref:glycosyltransferase family 4 protein n=1 Tax=Methylomonas sp. LWB TaxID=1905845 RepID=UPI0008DB02BE|nr:glycosyltransferase family 1 protein [Methylomonas sp. LWB]OHX34117.1 glycosyl transferase family 1 [Methylomonas sp. LWB]
MRVGIDYRPVVAAPYSGIARQVLALEQALIDGGAEVFRFSPAPADHPLRQRLLRPDEPSPAEGLHRPRERLKFEWAFLPKAVEAQCLDLYVATANTGLPVKRVAGTRYALLLHDVFQLTMQNYHASRVRALVYRWIDRVGIAHSVRLADVIWSPSAFTAGEVARLFPKQARRISVLPNAVPASANAADALPDGVPDRYWLVVGTREPRKNIPWFIENWRLARSSDAVIPELVLVGHPQDIPADQRDLPGLMMISGLSDSQLGALYAHADRLWQPSLAEGFGLPVVEALGHGTPVAVATGSALDEVAPPSAPRFSPLDGEALQIMMRRLAGDAPSRDTDSARQWAARYAMPEYTRRVWALVDDLINANH